MYISHLQWKVNYASFFRACTKIVIGSSQYSGGGTKTVNMFAKLMSQGSSFVMEGVKNLVVKKHVSRNIGNKMIE